MDELFSEIKKVAIRYNAEKIILYGSRARGDNRERSDIDIAVFGINGAERVRFEEAIDCLPTLLSFDIVFITEKTDKNLLKNIYKDGIVLMNKAEEKTGKLVNAVERLREAVDEYMNNPSDVIRDGVIQRFEFCTELSWKALREYLIDEGYNEINSPKAVMRTAYSSGFIDDENGWISLLNDRNITSHVYDNATAAEIFGNIKEIYLPLMKKLIQRLTA